MKQDDENALENEEQLNNDTNNNEDENIDDYNEEDDYESESEPIELNCPYCGDCESTCEHVLLHYDASFSDMLNGYILDNYEVLDDLEQALAELVSLGVKPKISSSLLAAIWECAVQAFNPETKEVDLDRTAYFNLLNNNIDSFGGETFRYNDEDGGMGYSSAYIVFYAEEPEETITEFNKWIIDTLRASMESGKKGKA